MEYKGKLYGRLGNDLYFDTSHTTDEWDAMEAKIKELEKPKRQPLADGTLPLTEKELEEFKKLFGLSKAKGIYVCDCEIRVDFDIYEPYTLTDYKAFLYLAERFNLE